MQFEHPSLIIITDLEAVGQVLNFQDFCKPSGYRNEEACRALTEEVNAAVEAAFDAGFKQVVVWDGHGSGGSIRRESLDERAFLQLGYANGFIYEPGTYDAMAFVGQHSKAGTAKAHLAHTQTQGCVDFKVNGFSIGEYGQHALSAAESGISTIFACGDLALALEAKELTPAVETVAVKEGLSNAPTQLDIPVEKVFTVQSNVMVYPKVENLCRIYKSMRTAAENFLANKESFIAESPVKPPYTCQALYRKENFHGLELPARVITTREHCTLGKALNEFYGEIEWIMPDGDRVFEVSKAGE